MRTQSSGVLGGSMVARLKLDTTREKLTRPWPFFVGGDSVSDARVLEAITRHFSQLSAESTINYASCPLFTAAPEFIWTNFRIVHRTPAELA